MYWALQAVVGLGAKQIAIAGMDLGGARFYDTELNAAPSRLDVDYATKIEPTFKFAAKQLAERHIQVSNCSANSRLPTTIFAKESLIEFINRN